MRLLKADSHGKLSLTQNLSKDIPSYAILSHTWATDEEDEVTISDLKNGSGKNKGGFTKIQFCREQAQKDGLAHFWVDTCCIDKANHAELAEAIVSMFRWYHHAEKCYVYLSDVSVGTDDKHHATVETWQSDFQKSRWFTRGWTLQELLAPKSVHFFSREGKWLGDRHTLERQIHEITGIPLMALRGVAVSNFSISERMRWVTKRNTTKPEDKAYCLLGIFDVFMPPIYGEGANAFLRLQDEIDKRLGGRVNADKLPNAQRPSPIWHVPFDQMSGFVGRTDELQNLKVKIFESDSRRIVSVLGLGGVGKSRLALELAYQIKVEHPQCSIFWIEAVDQLTFEKGVLEIGKELSILGIEDDKADIKHLFKQRLGSSSAERWLLILDNADEETLWGKHSASSSEAPTLAEYLPKTTNGSIIITTRTRRVANFLAGKEVIELSEMLPNEGAEMFIKALEKPSLAIDRAETLTLMDNLACLPLAIVQAASFINMTHQPVQTYLKLLTHPEEEVIKLLSKDFGDPSRSTNAKNPVATTWLISFDHIRQHHPLAAKFLSSMACFHEKSIPQSLLPEADSEVDIIDAIAVLTGYSFVRRQTGSSELTDCDELYDLHRLVQLAARNWLKMNGSLRDWTKGCITRVAELFPTRDHKYKSTWTAYLPHAQRLCEDSEVKDLPERYWLLEKMGLCFVVDGKYNKAVKAHTAVVQWREKGPEISGSQILEAYNNLGEALQWNGDLRAAEMYLQRALKGQQEVLGVEHPSTLTSMANLASTYRNQGRWKEAEELEVQVMETRKRVLGEEHPDTLTSMANLASTFWNQGRWKEAEELDVQVMETRKRVLGAEHPSTLTSMANLASTYRNRGRWKEAEELEVQVMETSSRVLGAEHPSTLTCMANLAYTLKEQSRDNEATDLMTSCLEISRKVLGHSHHHTQSRLVTLMAWLNIGNVMGDQGEQNTCRIPGAWVD